MFTLLSFRSTWSPSLAVNSLLYTGWYGSRPRILPEKYKYVQPQISIQIQTNTESYTNANMNNSRTPDPASQRVVRFPDWLPKYVGEPDSWANAMGGMWRKVKNVLLRMDVAPQCYSKWIGWVGMGWTSVGGMRYETLYSVEKMENMQIKSRSLFLFMLQMIIRWRLPHLWKKSPMTIHQRRRTKVTRKI